MKFIEVSPGIEKIVLMVLKLRPGESLEVMPDRRGKKGLYFVKRTLKETTDDTLYDV